MAKKMCECGETFTTFNPQVVTCYRCIPKKKCAKCKEDVRSELFSEGSSVCRACCKTEVIYDEPGIVNLRKRSQDQAFEAEIREINDYYADM